MVDGNDVQGGDGTARGCGQRWGVALGVLLVVGSLDSAAHANTYTVTTTAGSGVGSLRRAISDANANPGVDSIAFNIPGASPHVIAPTSALPQLTDPVVIDGTTQPGYSGAPLVVLDGSGVANVRGLEILAADCDVRGLVIHSWRVGVEVAASGATVEACWIGIDASGVVARSNRNGVRVLAAGVFARIADCVVSGNVEEAIELQSSDGVVEGCTIGLDPARAIALPNADGIVINAGAARNVVRSNHVAANPGSNVLIDEFTTTDNSVVDNVLGFDGNRVFTFSSTHGILVRDADSALVQGNLIAASGSAGIRVEATRASSTGARLNRLANNRFGVFSSSYRMIDIAAPGLDSNDPLDADTGANERQNRPDLHLAISAGSVVFLAGSLHSVPLTTFDVEFFASENPYAETILLANHVFTTDANGDATFALLFPGLPTGSTIYSTATDPLGNTSEVGDVYVRTLGNKRRPFRPPYSKN